jgi:YYY domain-containing protein
MGSDGFYDWVDVSGLTADEPRYGQWYPADFFQFFGSTRIYPLDDADFRVITEFPMFSFVLGDLHPHVMALPFVLLVVALALSLFRSDEPLDVTFWLQRPLLILAAAVMLGGLTFINTWDVATFGIVITAAVFVSNFTRIRRVTLDLFVQTISFALPLALLAFLFYVPFVVSISGNSQVNGVSAVVTNSTLTHAGTRPLHLFLFWGPLFVIVMPFIVARLWPARQRITSDMLILAVAPAVIIVLGWMLVFLLQKADLPLLAGLLPEENLREGSGSIFKQIGDRGVDWITFIILGVCLATAILALCTELTAVDDREERGAALFALTLAAVALLLILGCEFFFIGDVFTSRMNTVFKLYYQAWLLLALAAGFALYYLASTWRMSFPEERPYRLVWGAAAALVLIGAALYPIAGTLNRARPYNEAGRTTIGGSLHGLGTRNPDELAAFDFLSDRAKGQDFVIVEAVGGDYTEAGRVSMATGIPAVLGWKGHEDQWRDGDCKPCSGRFEDVNALYTASDLSGVSQIVEKYDISYIYVGPLEVTTYGQEAMGKFQQLPVAFRQGAVTIYRARG